MYLKRLPGLKVIEIKDNHQAKEEHMIKEIINKTLMLRYPVAQYNSIYNEVFYTKSLRLDNSKVMGIYILQMSQIISYHFRPERNIY